MKTFNIFLISFCIVHHVQSQNKQLCNSQINFDSIPAINISKVTNGYHELSLNILGTKTQLIVDSLINEKEQKNYTTKLKHVQIPGIKDELILTIRQGVHGKKEDNCHSYFNTFQSEEQKTIRMNQMTKLETLGITIHIKKKGYRREIQSEAECDLVIAYLEQITLNQ